MANIFINGSLSKHRVLLGLYSYKNTILEINAISVDIHNYNISGQLSVFINPDEKIRLAEMRKSGDEAVAKKSVEYAIECKNAKKFSDVMSDFFIWMQPNSIITYYGEDTKRLFKNSMSRDNISMPDIGYINLRKTISKSLKTKELGLKAMMGKANLKIETPISYPKNITCNLYRLISFLKFKSDGTDVC